jgi:hypothetical protein
MPKWCRLVEWRACVSVDPWLDRLGRGDTAQWIRDFVCMGPQLCKLCRLVEWILCRPGGHGPAEWRWCMCVSQAWQALGVWLAEQRLCRLVQVLGMWPSGTEIMHVAGLGDMAQWRWCRPAQGWRGWSSGTEIVCLCISSVAGLAALPSETDPARLCRPEGMAWQRS